jgi:hypothetical protein
VIQTETAAVSSRPAGRLQPRQKQNLIVSVFHIFCIQSLLLCYNLLPYKSVNLHLNRGGGNPRHFAEYLSIPTANLAKELFQNVIYI